MTAQPTPLGTAQVAKLLGRSQRRVQEYVANGWLPAVRCGARGHFAITLEDVQELLRPRREDSP